VLVLVLKEGDTSKNKGCKLIRPRIRCFLTCVVHQASDSLSFALLVRQASNSSCSGICLHEASNSSCFAHSVRQTSNLSFVACVLHQESNSLCASLVNGTSTALALALVLVLILVPTLVTDTSTR
jgi:hypothetical protein